MKISIYVRLFPPKRLGGTEIATYNIAKYLAKKGHEIHILTELDIGLPRKSKEGGFYVHRFYWPKIRFLGGIFFWIKIIYNLKKINPDIVHFQTIGIGIPALILKKILKKPFVYWARGSDIYLQLKDKNWMSKFILKNADSVIVLTEHMKNQVKKIYKKNIFLIPNGIDLNKFEGLLKDDLRIKLGFKKDEKIILYVGTLRPVKGLQYLIEAMKIINEDNIKLLLVGRGEQRKYLENLVEKFKIEKCVNFIGNIPNIEVFKYMSASDVFVLPSLSEGFPVVILEAMASGLPIIATNVSGLPEIIKERENGFLVEPKNPEQIADKIILLLKDEKLKLKLSANNRKKVKSYSWESVINKLEKIYFNLIKTDKI